MNPFSTAGNIGSLFQGNPKYKTQSTVKNPLLQEKIDAVGTDYDSVKGLSSKALDEYIKDYLSGSADAKARSEQEQAVVGGYYDGTVQNELAKLREARSQASQDAVARALAYATRNQNLSRVGAEGTGSSYDRAIADRTATDIEVANALQQADQERADWDYLMRSKLGMVGQRQAMSDALLSRGLVPANMKKAELGWDIGALADLLKLDQANKFYGVGQKKGLFDKVIDVTNRQGDIFNQDMATMTNLISAVRGGGGGAAPSAAPYNSSNQYGATFDAGGLVSRPQPGWDAYNLAALQYQ